MSDEKIGLTRRKALLGIGTVGVAAAGAGAGTFAYFSDTEESTGNTVSAGTLNLTPDGVSSLSYSVGQLAPGASTGTESVDLQNDGSIAGDHLEAAFTVTGESDGTNPSEYPGDPGANEFARRLFVDDLSYGGSPVGWGYGALSTLKSSPGALLVDGDQDSDRSMMMERVDDPAGGGRDGVVHVHTNGDAVTDYAVSMRDGFDVRLGDVSEIGGGGTEVTYDYYGGAGNENAEPDEVYVVIDDNGTRRLLCHTGNDGTQPEQTWKTRDVGAEISGNGSPLNQNYNWQEITASGTTSHSKPTDGGIASDFPDATLKAVGFGRGNTSTDRVTDLYFDNLVVGGETHTFRPLSLFDLEARGTLDSLAGLAPNNNETKTFSTSFTLDSLVGNRFQADGVEFEVTFGLAQEGSQSVI